MLAAGRGPADVRPDRARLRRDEPGDDGRARPALAPDRGRGGRETGRPRARRVLRHRRPGGRVREARRRRHRPGLLAGDARAGAPQACRPRRGWRGTCSPCRSRPAPSRRQRSVSASATSPTSSRGWSSSGASSSRAGASPCSRSPSPAGSSLPSTGSGSTGSCRCSAALLKGGAAYTYLPASVRRFPGPDELANLMGSARLRGRLVPHLRRRDRRAPRREAPRDERAGDDPRDTWARPLPRGAGGAAGGDRRLPRRDRCRRLARCAERGRQAAAAAARLLLRAGRTSAVRGRGDRGRARAHGHARPRRPDRRRRVPPRPRLGLVGLRPGRCAGDRRLPVRARVRRAGGDGGRAARSRCSRTQRCASRAARRCSAARHTIRIRPWRHTWSAAA